MPEARALLLPSEHRRAIEADVYPLLTRTTWIATTSIFLSWIVLFDRSMTHIFCLSISLFLMISIATEMYFIVSRSILAVLSPIFCFFLVSFAYFGFGPLIYLFGKEESIAYCNSFYEVREGYYLLTQLLNLVSIATICVSYLVSGTLLNTHRGKARKTTESEENWFLFATLAIGLLVKYIFSLPYELGLTEKVLPGAVIMLGGCTIIALFLLAFKAGRDGGYWWLYTFLFAGSEITISLLTFSKLDLLQTLATTFAGFLVARPARKHLVIALVLLTLVYFSSIDLVTHCRRELRRHTAPTLESRLQVATEYISNTTSDIDRSPKIQTWWVRLSYTNAQAFAMQSYNDGMNGNTYSLIAYAWIPRFLWPEKPLITVGAHFNYLVTGNDRSQSSPGIFAEGYWNGGWSYVVLTCLFVGFLFRAFELVCWQTFVYRDFRYLPCAFISIKMALRPDDWFASTYVGALGFAVVYFLILAVFWPRRIDEPSRTPAA